MSLTFMQNALLHQIVRDFDHAKGAAKLDVPALTQLLGVSEDQLAKDIQALVAEGYAEVVPGDDPWSLSPTDMGLMTAMGLA